MNADGKQFEDAKGWMRGGHREIWVKGPVWVFVCAKVWWNCWRKTDQRNVKTWSGIPPPAKQKRTLRDLRETWRDYFHYKVSVYSHVGVGSCDWTTGCFRGLKFRMLQNIIKQIKLFKISFHLFVAFLPAASSPCHSIYFLYYSLWLCWYWIWSTYDSDQRSPTF